MSAASPSHAALRCSTMPRRLAGVAIPARLRPTVQPASRALLRAALLVGMAAAAQPLPHAHSVWRARCNAAASSSSISSSGDGNIAHNVQPDHPFSLLRISGDGRCLFRSLAQGAHLAAQLEEDAAAAAGRRPTQPQLLPLQEETAAADKLRAGVCAELLKRREELYFFIDEDYDAYVHRMQQPHTWGGEPELAVATHVLQRPISVFAVSAGQLALVSRYGEEEHSGKADVPVFFHGAGHYDLLVRQQPMLPPVSRL